MGMGELLRWREAGARLQGVQGSGGVAVGLLRALVVSVLVEVMRAYRMVSGLGARGVSLSRVALEAVG